MVALPVGRVQVGIVLGEGKMPVRQSHNELNYGFLITVPVPVVVRKELRACKNPVSHPSSSGSSFHPRFRIDSPCIVLALHHESDVT